MSNVITIDGPAGSGKSTVGRTLAGKINFLYLDTGAMYRAVALAARRERIDSTDTGKLGELCKTLRICFKTSVDEDAPKLFLGEEDITRLIRSPEMDMLSSEISAIREVREAMTELQRKMSDGVGVVAEGRDMGTVVFPEAKHKFFLTASLEIRTQRRYEERLAQGEPVTRALVAADLKKRDEQDQNRPIAPLEPAKDAVVIDSTRLSVDEVVGIIINQLKK